MKTNLDVLKPQCLADFVGQEALKAELAVALDAARAERRPLDHLLLIGPPGMGKTTLAWLLSVELGPSEAFLAIDCPLQREDYQALRHFQGGILMVDEVHRSSHGQQEELMTLMDRGFIKPKGMTRIEPPWVTLVAATTEEGKLTRTFKDRFPMAPRFDPYTEAEMLLVAYGMAAIADADLDDGDLAALALASVGVPRRLSMLIRAARSMQVAYGRKVSAAEVLALRRVESDGLDLNHVRYLTVLYQHDAAVGLSNLKNLLDSDEASIRDWERVLYDLGLILRTGQGRELTPKGNRRARELVR